MMMGDEKEPRIVFITQRCAKMTAFRKGRSKQEKRFVRSREQLEPDDQNRGGPDRYRF